MKSYLAEFGFVYVATGERFVRECIASARSLRAVMPDAVIVLHSDLSAADIAALAAGTHLFDEIVSLENPRHDFFDKLEAFLNPRFERSVFLDTDTFVCRAMPELFELLERFDLAAVRADWAHAKSDSPFCFDDFNTGVIAFRDTDATKRVFARWREIYSGQIGTGRWTGHDQPAFREAVYGESDASIYVLPRRYNLRTVGPMVLRHGSLPVVLHGRGYDFGRLLAELSCDVPYRVALLSGEQLSMLGFVGGTPPVRKVFIPWIRLMQAVLVALYRIKRRRGRTA